MKQKIMDMVADALIAILGVMSRGRQKAWEQKAKADMTRLKDEDLSSEQDAW